MRNKYEITLKRPIDKGWSGDGKFYIETASGDKMFMRTCDISEFERKKTEHEMTRRMYEAGVRVPRPLEYGVCDDGKNAFFLSGWIDGRDAELQLPLMDANAQTAAGLMAGEVLRKIHSLSVPIHGDWRERYFNVIGKRIDAYHTKGMPFEGSDIILAYLEQNSNLTAGRPQRLLHGDFHEGNLMFSDNGELYVIDLFDEGFGFCGDPWYDFRLLIRTTGTRFIQGLIRGYFNGEAPEAFWEVLTYYVVASALCEIVWLAYNKPDELPAILEQNEKNARLLREGRLPAKLLYTGVF